VIAALADDHVGDNEVARQALFDDPSGQGCWDDAKFLTPANSLLSFRDDIQLGTLLVADHHRFLCRSVCKGADPVRKAESARRAEDSQAIPGGLDALWIASNRCTDTSFRMLLPLPRAAITTWPSEERIASLGQGASERHGPKNI
jgi:hypothetical protein